MEAKSNRRIMKSDFSRMEGIMSDQQKNLPQPPLEKPFPEDGPIIDLPDPKQVVIPNTNITSCIESRKSRRNYLDESISLAQLSYLLWSSQGVKSVITRMEKAYATLRTVPSAGARHPFETYLTVYRVDGLEPGIYRYLALEHKLFLISEQSDLQQKMITATFGQEFAGRCSVVFVWTCVAYRGEWRYHMSAHKAMLLDSGHVCQNLYLACEALGLGTCAIAAYDQEKIDQIVGVNGDDEFSVYLAPVGKYQ